MENLDCTVTRGEELRIKEPCALNTVEAMKSTLIYINVRCDGPTLTVIVYILINVNEKHLPQKQRTYKCEEYNDI